VYKIAAYYKYLIDIYELDCTPEELITLRNDIYKKYIRESADLKPKIELFINELKKRKKVLLLATTSNKIHINRFFSENITIKNKLNLMDTFESNILTSDNIKLKKPHPEIYLKALSVLKANPSECIAIEDALNGIEAAKGAGLEVIAIYDKNSDFERKQINNLSDYQANDFNELIDILKEEETID
jgi:HAD superfamily hydrolase (TIGR01509 family)